MKKIIKILVLMIFAFSGFSQTTNYIRPAHDCLGSGAPIEAPNPDYGCSTWYDTLNNAEYRFQDGVWFNKTAANTVNLYNSNGTIPNGSNRAIINSSEGLKIVDQNYPDNEIRFLSDYDADGKVGMNFTNTEESANGYIGMVEEKMKIISQILIIEEDAYRFNEGIFFDKRNVASRKGIKLSNFGESDDNDTGNTADYSTLVNTSLVPKKYVDDNAGAKEINDLSDGISDGSSVYLGENVGINGGSNKTNVGIGVNALNSITSGSKNVVVGYNAMANSTMGLKNVIIGEQAGFSGDNFFFSVNTLVGYKAGFNITTGGGNIGVGDNVFPNLVSGSHNIGIGQGVDVDDPSGDYQLNIGDIIKGDMTSGSESVKIEGSLYQKALSADPADPPSGYSVRWLSDGTGSGDDGDIMEKITNSAGVTKIRTVVDFSAL